MANTFVSIKELALKTLERLNETIVFPNLMAQDISGDYVNGKGDTVLAQLPYYFSATEFDEAAGVSAQDIQQNTVPVTLDKIADATVEWGAIEGATRMGENKLNKILEGMATAIAEKINDDGAGLYADIPYFTGAAGTTPDGVDDFASARKLLNKNKCPKANRCIVWNDDADAAMIQLDAFKNAAASGSTAALREASLGRVYGFENYSSQGLKFHATGITGGTAVKVNGAVAEGATKLSIDGTTLTGKLVKGDLMQIDGKQYVVTKDSAAAATNAIADIEIYPAAPAAIADNKDVTLIAGHAANMAFHRDAFAFVTRPLLAPADKESYTTGVSNSPIQLRVVRGYDMKFKKDMLSMDILYGYKTLCPQMAAVILG